MRLATLMQGATPPAWAMVGADLAAPTIDLWAQTTYRVASLWKVELETSKA